VQSKAISAAELAGATFTLSYPGRYGADAAAPIITPPQVAALTAGAVRDVAVVQEGEPGHGLLAVVGPHGVTNAFQAHPEIDAIFDPSDYLLPAVVSALKATQHFYPVGNAKHVTVVTIDGDNNGCYALRTKLSLIHL